MKVVFSAWILTVLLLFLLGTDVEASRRLRDVSGDPMQSYDSRMMSSPMTRFPGLFGISVWPYIIYPPAPSMTILNVAGPNSQSGSTANDSVYTAGSSEVLDRSVWRLYRARSEFDNESDG